MKKLAGLIFSLAVIILFSSCSSKEVTKDETPKKDSTYVFDQVPVDTVKHQEVPKVEPMGTRYTVQMGAFTTQEKADAFTAAAKKKLNHEMTIKFSSEVNLFVVQITPPYATKMEADKERDNIKQFQEYKDAWTVTIK
jgi:cell division protein FtsN